MSSRGKPHQALGQVVRTRREAAGLSQEQLAFAAELDRTYIGGIERGERNPTFESLLTIAKALKVSLHDLFTEARL